MEKKYIYWSIGILFGALLLLVGYVWVSYVQPKLTLFDPDKVVENFAHI